MADELQNATQKTCPRCATSVGSAAKVCPACRYSFRLRLAKGTLIGGCIVAALLILTSIGGYLKWKQDDRARWDACQLRNNRSLTYDPTGGSFEKC